MTNFLDLSFDERTTLEILKWCPLLNSYSSGNIIKEEDSSNYASSKGSWKSSDDRGSDYTPGKGWEQGAFTFGSSVANSLTSDNSKMPNEIRRFLTNDSHAISSDYGPGTISQWSSYDYFNQKGGETKRSSHMLWGPTFGAVVKERGSLSS